jgi:ssDNA-binding Zn-finger/Zn-ribbon topoisomerase 1/KaiC/GvpD/RAD55 family RecA-like ATPase
LLFNRRVPNEQDRGNVLSEALSQMIEALGLEVAAIRKRGGGTQIELRGGERIGQAEDNWLYRFPVGEDLNLRDDTPVRLICGDRETSGVLVSFRDGVLVVAVEADVGPKIAFARLVADDSFLVERLKERLDEVRTGEAQFNKAGASRVIGEASVRTGDAEPETIGLQGDGSLNEEQRAAIRRSLGSDTIFVWGPPGTGKTTTLARIVEAHYRSGRSVLLVSNTNIAVDTALEKVAERLKGEPEFHQGAVLRQGPVVKDELRQKFGPQVILEEVVARLGEALRREKEYLQRQVAALEREEQPLIQAVAEHERFEELRRTLAEAETSLAAMRKSVQAREAEAKQQRLRADALRADLERARTMGRLRRVFAGLNLERLEREIAVAERAGHGARDAARALAEESKRREAKARELQREGEQLAQSMRLYPALVECRKRLEALREKLRPVRERIAAIDRELAALADEVLGRCRILASTVYRTYLGAQKSRSFDVAVIDEASMLMLPLTYYAAGLATHVVVVAGDFRQLPPIVTSDETAAEEWLKRDVFEKAGIPEKLRRHSAPPELVSLRTQYRMREPICGVVNRFFYSDHPLRTDASVGRVSSRFPLGDAPLLYVDTSPFHPWAALRLGTYSRYNLFHALVVRNIVLHLADVGYLPRADRINDAVGAVSPYGAQSKLIQALLEDRLGGRAASIAATVHRFQGNEKDAMLLDLTDSYGAKLGRFLAATDIEEDGARLLNVAVSRARHHVVLIANFDYLRAKASDTAIVRHIIEHFAEQGEALDVESLLPLADRDWVDALHRVISPGFELPDGVAGAFTEGTFYPAFAQDLLKAKSAIVIFSPFVTAPGVSRWVEHLRGALARGLAVRVVMRPPGEAGGAPGDEVAELVHELRALGVAVDLRARMHEKIAVLDGRVLWHGSLNILSHRDTHESMLRIESTAACEALGRFVSTPTGQKDDRIDLHAPENPACPTCGSPTVWNSGRYGIWFRCAKPDCDGKVDPRHRGQRSAGSQRSGRAGGRAWTGVNGRKCPQPGCGGRLVERSGKHGRFLGCTRYPRCRHTENLG